MARKKSREELEREITRLQASEEALYALQTAVKGAGYWGFGVTLIQSGEGDDYRSIEIVGLERAAGGVIVAIDGSTCAPVYLSDWCQRIEANPGYSVYAKDVAARARRAQNMAVRVRMSAKVSA